MLRRLSKRLNYANVMSTIAVFGVLATGTAYAANTVFSTDIVDGEVRSVDIRNDDIQSGDIKDNSINTFDVHSFLGVDVVDGTLTGADVQDGSLTGFDIQDGFIGQGELADGAVNSAKVADGSLDDQDIAQATFVNFEANIGPVATGFCATKEVTGINASGDHLVLTASQSDASPVLSYTAEYAANGSAWIKVCNAANFNVDDGITHFNLLVIDAQ